jgi:hypothetical protein
MRNSGALNVNPKHTGAGRMYLRRNILAALGAQLLVLLPVAASKAQPSPSAPSTSPPLLPDRYSLLCQVQQSVGFNWLAGDWAVTKFKPDALLVIKSPDNVCYGPLEAHLDIAVFEYRDVCLNGRTVGSPYFKYSSSKCTEYYIYTNGG